MRFSGARVLARAFSSRNSKGPVRPAPLTPGRELAGALGFLGLLVGVDRYSTYVHYLSFGGLLYLLAIIFIACWAGLRSALAGCLILLCYVWLIYHYRISVFPKDQTKELPTLISVGIIYPFFAITFGIVQAKLRGAAIREFDAREAAENEHRKRKAAEAGRWASEEMRNLIVQYSIDAIVGLAEDGTITMWNPNAEKLFGWTEAESIGAPVEDRIDLRSDAPERDGRRGLLRLTEALDCRESVEAKISSRDGIERDIDVSIARHGGAEGTLFIVFARDVTDRKRSEREIRDLNANLEERVIRRTADLKAANEELMAFTYSVSHDLRAPLRAIVGMSRIVREETHGNLNAAAAEGLKRMEKSALRMSDLIDNLLEFARIGQAALARRDVDLTTMARQIGSELTSTGPGTVQVQPGLVVDADPALLKLLLRNLMENAWK